METKSPTPWTTLLLIAACGLAFVARLFPWSEVFRDGQVYFFADDCHYHMRRVQLIIAHFPRVPILDSYIAYPEGAYVNWPPLFDFVIALLALVAGLGHPSPRLIEVLAAFVPPALGALTLVPVYLIARSLAGRAAGILAAFMLALMPGHVSYTMLGRVDHHVAEALILAWAWWFFVSAFSPPTAANTRRFLLAGFFLGVLFLVQSASTVYAAPLSFAIVAQCLTYFDAEIVAQKSRNAGIAFAVAGAMALPFAALAPTMASSDTPFMGLSWFHVAILAGACSFLLIVAKLAKAGLWGGWRRLLNMAIAGAVTALGLLVMAALFPQLSDTLRSSAKFMFKADQLGPTIFESRPLFNTQDGLAFNARANILLSWALYLVPIVLVWMLAARRPEERRLSPPRTFFLVATLCFGVMVLLQQRFVYIFALNVSIAFAYLIVGMAQKMGPILSRRAPQFVGGFAAAFALFILVHPALRYFYCFRTADRYFAIDPGVHCGFLWMREHTPKTHHYDSPNTTPEYGVLCEWDKGHALEYVAHRPVVVNNFGVYMSREAVMDSLRFLVTESETEAAGIVERRRVRYVATTPLLSNISGYCETVGVDPFQYVDQNSQSGNTVSPRPDLFRLVGVRLHERDGFEVTASPQTSPAARLEHFRLIYEATAGEQKANGLTTTPLKIFEFVPGARLTGKGLPNQTVYAVTSLKTNTSRRVEYKAERKCAPDGTFTIVIPYPTRNASYPVQTEGDFNVACGPLSARVAIEESAVEKGDKIQVALTLHRASK